MERLTEQQRTAVSKMSDDRLRSKLVQAGYQEDVVSRLDRQSMMLSLATYMADQEELAQAAVAREEEMEGEEIDESTETQAGTLSLERRLALEERRLRMEEQRWKAEMLSKERMEELRLREEMKIEEQRLKDETKLKEQELELKHMMAEREEKYKETPAVKLKLWGDALRNTISRMPNEPIVIVSRFISLDRLFEQLSVPDDLRAVLVRPYLNERAKNLLSRCDPSKTHDYKVVKKFLLQKMQLTPSVYLDKFNSVSKESNETYHQFGNRLTSLFEYYVESRQVSNSYKKLMRLMIYDRIKSSLPSFLARHVLALEAPIAEKGGWLGRQELIEALDAYVAGMNNPPKPLGSVQKGAVTFPNKSLVGKSVPNNVTKVTTENNAQGISSTHKPVVTRPRRCFECGATGHIAYNCPNRRNTFSAGNNSKYSKQVSHCKV